VVRVVVEEKEPLVPVKDLVVVVVAVFVVVDVSDPVVNVVLV
jgi:hypothetical protein